MILDKKTSSFNPTIQPKKFLFLRQDGKIGDYIVSSFVFREIKKHLPNCYIGVICTRKNTYLFEKDPYIDQLYFVKAKDICDYIKCGKRLAEENYDVVIDPTVELRNRDLLFLRLISAKNYVGYQKGDYRLFNLNIKYGKDHFSDVYKKALEVIGFNNISTDYCVPFDQNSERDILSFLKENSISNYLVVNFFGAGSARRLNDNSIRKLLDILTINTKDIVLLTYPEVTEKLNQISKNYKNVFVYQNTKTIFHSISLIKYSKMVISPDTSVVHIASAFQKPMIAFYSNDEENFIHWHPNNRAETHILRFNKNINELDFNQISPDWFRS